MAALPIMPNMIPNSDYIRILPEIVLSVSGMIIMLLDPIMDERRSQRTLGVLALLGAIAALAATCYQAQQQFWGFGFWEMVKVDPFSIFFHVVVIAVTIVVILSSYEYMEVQQIRAGEYYGLILFGAVGMALMSSAVELVLIFIALEISSIATYILAEIFSAGVVCDSFLSVRRSHDIWRDRFDQHCSDQRVANSLQRKRRPLTGVPGGGTHVCRAGLQGGRGSISCLDAGCL
jgi:hypothetical protein